MKPVRAYSLFSASALMAAVLFSPAVAAETMQAQDSANKGSEQGQQAKAQGRANASPNAAPINMTTPDFTIDGQGEGVGELAPVNTTPVATRRAAAPAQQNATPQSKVNDKPVDDASTTADDAPVNAPD